MSMAPKYGIYLTMPPCPEDRLLNAVLEGDLHGVQEALKHGPDVNIQDNGESLLSIAVSNGTAEIVNTLLQHGVDPTGRNVDGTTPLYYAILKCDPEMVSALIKFGASPESIDGLGDGLPLHCAAEGGDVMSVRMLAKAFPSHLNAFDRQGYTPLMAAVRRSDYAIVCELLDLGADVNSCDYQSYCESALHVAALYPSEMIIRRLLAAGADASAADYLSRRPVDVLIQESAGMPDANVLRLLTNAVKRRD
jgi:ankyrin repeat protein